MRLHALPVALILTLACTAVTAPAAIPYELTAPQLAQLAAGRDAALRRPIETVVDKSGPSPTGDAHDYVSYARYWWPNPDTSTGLPYVRHDGHHNEVQVAKGDRGRIGRFCSTVVTLAAAWSADHDAAAARRAGDWLRAWFVTPATRMNPNLEYAQVRLGHAHNHGSNSGVLDGRGLGDVVDALQLLDGSPALSSADATAIRGWYTQYLHWLLTAPNAQKERAAKNNHGTWYLAQAIPIARYVGRDDVARELAESDKALLAHQIRPDGSQPEELRRVDGLGYSKFNLEAQFHVAALAAPLGIDLWHYTAPDGSGSLKKAVAYLRPYNADPSKWPHAQRAKLKPGFLDEILKQADAVWGGR